MTILERAEKLIYGPREHDYGHPIINLQKIADLWSAFLGITIKAWQVAIMMALLKIARIATGGPNEDNEIDAAGYLGLLERLREKQQ